LIALALASVFVFPVLMASHRSPESRVKSDMRSMATAIESYRIDYDTYPTTVPLAAFLPLQERGNLRRAGGAGLACPSNLTTPVAYLTSFFLDPFAPGSKIPFAYYADEDGWVLVSPGPDGKYDINPESDYSSSVSQPSLRLLAKYYDPTNGAVSPGDLVRVKQ
jgi:hypothetical protein